MTFTQLIFTAPDTYGKPRRIYALYDEQGHLTRVYDAGAGGRPAHLSNAVQLPAVRVTPTEFRLWKHRAITNNIYEKMP